MMFAAPSHVTWVDEITRHEAASVKCSWPVVVVPSAYVPSGLAVHVPLTWSDPVTGADGQPAPTSPRSSSPLTFRHDEVTVHAPTTLPPHAVTLEQAPAPPPAPLPVLPPVPDALPELELHAAPISPHAITIARTADRTLFMLRLVAVRNSLLRNPPAHEHDQDQRAH